METLTAHGNVFLASFVWLVLFFWGVFVFCFFAFALPIVTGIRQLFTHIMIYNYAQIVYFVHLSSGVIYSG